MRVTIVPTVGYRLDALIREIGCCVESDRVFRDESFLPMGDSSVRWCADSKMRSREQIDPDFVDGVCVTSNRCRARFSCNPAALVCPTFRAERNRLRQNKEKRKEQPALRNHIAYQ